MASEYNEHKLTLASVVQPAAIDGAKFWLKLLLISIWAWVSLSVLSDHVFRAGYLDYFKYVSRFAQSPSARPC